MTEHTFTTEQIDMLKRPLRESLIKERDGGGGKKFKYIKTDNAIDTANEIFGYGQWGTKIVSRGEKIIKGTKNIVENGKVVGKEEIYNIMYTVELELHVAGAAFPFTGDGVGTGNNASILDHEKAYKEASSDALKRALRHYGDQFGLSLYDQNDLVEMDNGELKRVGDVKVQPNRSQQQQTRTQQSAQPKPAPQEPTPIRPLQAQQQATRATTKPYDVESEINRLFVKAQNYRLVEDNKLTFWNKIVVKAVNADVKNTGQMTKKRNEQVEAYIEKLRNEMLVAQGTK